MAYDEQLGERIHRILTENKHVFYEKKMMGGLCFMMNDKMLCGVLYNKKKQMDLLMARVGEEQYEEAIKYESVHPMDFTGRPMKGYIFVDPDGFDLDEDLERWVHMCVHFNPQAKASKKKKAKK